MKYDNGGASTRKMSFPPPAGAGETNTATGVNGNVKQSLRIEGNWTSLMFSTLINSSKVTGLGRKYAKVKNYGIKASKMSDWSASNKVAAILENRKGKLKRALLKSSCRSFQTSAEGAAKKHQQDRNTKKLNGTTKTKTKQQKHIDI